MSIQEYVSADMRINEVVRVHPETVSIFHRYGMDACCGGAKTIEEAAAAHRLDLAEVLEALNGIAGRDATPLH